MSFKTTNSQISSFFLCVTLVTLLVPSGGLAQDQSPVPKHPLTEEQKDLKLPAVPFDALLVPVRMAFDSESRDDTWASSAEQRIDDAISGSGNMATFGSYHAECRKNLCRVVFYEAELDPLLDQLAMKVGDAVAGGAEHAQSGAIAHHELIDTGEYYFGRADYQIDLTEQMQALREMYPQLDAARSGGPTR